MEFNITLTLDAVHLDKITCNNKSKVVYDLAKSINNFISKNDYGTGINEYSIILYIVDPPIGYEHLHRDFKPKFIEEKILTNRHTGEKIELSKYFSYSIKITGGAYSEFVGETDNQSKKNLAKEILNSLVHLNKLPKKVKDFDKEKFKMDLEEFFKKENLV